MAVSPEPLGSRILAARLARELIRLRPDGGDEFLAQEILLAAVGRVGLVASAPMITGLTALAAGLDGTHRLVRVDRVSDVVAIPDADVCRSRASRPLLAGTSVAS